MLYVCIRDAMDAVFSVCIVTHGAVGARVVGSMSICMYLGSNSFFKISESKPYFLIKGEMIVDLQDAGKTPDEKQRFTIRKIILIIEDR